ncbi:DUF1456 family protein [Burkholderiaceae bacterium DAT-1]|nr:DUF1456 family protein [Burkholderiaceae bacterium DAT-1]
MISNDILRSVRFMLNISDRQIAAIIQEGGMEVGLVDVLPWMKKEDEAGFQICDDTVLARFLDGLIIFKRGRQADRPLPPLELPVYNNQVLKKLRVAFELRDDDIIAILETVDLRVSKAELGAFFRAPDHKNYRRCGDQFLRNFLKGLTLKLRPGVDA